MPLARTIAFSLLAMLAFSVLALLGGLCDILRKPKQEELNDDE